jgi:hypothetical protein
VAGLRFGGGVRASAGVKSLPQARYGSVPSPRSPSEAAYGPIFTAPTASVTQTLAPNDAFGIATWVGVASMAMLIYIYTTLPN